METSNLKLITDFFVWLAFVTTLIATLTLVVAGSVQLITQGWPGLLTLSGSIITLAMHYAVRIMPISKRGRGGMMISSPKVPATVASCFFFFLIGAIGVGLRLKTYLLGS